MRDLARRLLTACVPDDDGPAIFGDLVEELERPGRGSGPGRSMWFWRQVALACVHGLMDRVGDRVNAARRQSALASLRADLAAAGRTWVRRPGAWAPIALLVALGIGLNTAMFSVVRATLLAPLPYPEAAQLRILVGTSQPQDWQRASLSVPELEDAESGVPQLGRVGVFRTGLRLSLSDTERPTPVRVGLVDSDFFELLGTAPHLGRTFVRSDDDPEGVHAVAVVGHDFWAGHLGGDPEAIGRSITLSGTRYRVVGVMPPGFVGLFGPGRPQSPQAYPEVWLPLSMGRPYLGSEMLRTRDGRQYIGVFRANADVSDGWVETGLDRVAAELERRFPRSHEGRGIRSLSVQEFRFGHLEGAIRILMAGAAIVLAICCLNVAVLLLLQGRRRQGELALRLSLGARRSRVIRHLVLENAWIAAVGGVLGMALGWVTLRALATVVAPSLVPSGGLGLDPAVLLASVGAIGLTGLLFGALPAMASTRPDRVTILRTRGTEADSPGGFNRWAEALVLSEVAVAVVFLVGAGLAARALTRVVTIPLGYDTEDVLAVSIEFSTPVPPSDDPAVAWRHTERARAQRADFAARFIDEARGVSGVEDAAFFGPHPLDRLNWHRYLTPDWSDPSVVSNRSMGRDLQVTPGAFDLLGVPRLAGRDFTPEDRMGARKVAIVDRAVAESLWPGEDPLGRVFYSGTTRDFGFTVVGVVETAHHAGRLRDDPSLAGDVFVPYRMIPWRFATLMVRVRGDAVRAGTELRHLAHRIWPDAILFEPTPLDQLVRQQESVPRLTAVLMSVYSGIAALMAVVGVYGVVALAARRRRREVALRSALGAPRPQLLGLILVRGVLPVGVGLPLGLLAARTLGSVVDPSVRGMGVVDPWVYGSVAALVLLAGPAASLAAARKVVGLEPMRVLGTE